MSAKRNLIDVEARAIMLLAHAVEGLPSAAIERISNYLHDRYVRDEICEGLSISLLQELNAARAMLEKAGLKLPASKHPWPRKRGAP